MFLTFRVGRLEIGTNFVFSKTMKMKGRLVTNEIGEMRVEIFAGGSSIGDFKIDETLSLNIDYLQMLIHRNQAELMLDPSELTKKTAKAIIDFIPLHLETARLQLALKAAIDDNYKESSPLDKYTK